MNELELITPNQIIRSKRKSITLVIKNNGDFIVRAPIKVKESEIHKFIIQKKEWVIKKRLDQLSNIYNELTFKKPESINILGKTYNIELVDKSRVKLENNIIEVPKINSKERVVRFLKNFTRKYIYERVEIIAKQNNFQYNKISISSAKTNWGSCSHNNCLNFTYKLIMCPTDVVDYIVLHELCHTKIKNHSSKFWTLVKSIKSDYKLYESWLKKNRGIIDII